MASTVDELDLYEKYLALSDKLKIAEEDKTKWVCDKVATALAARDKQIELEKERREHELKILTLRQTVSHTDNAESAGLSEKPSKKPRFPMFNALIQDIDVYLDNFSRHPTASKWPQREWPSILFNLLQGEALTVLLSLSDADRECYEKVRDALLRYGNCTISGFNKKFRSSAPLESENFETFVNRVKRYFDRWIGLANVSTFEQLVFLMLKEQIYSSCSDELAKYLKDRKPTSLEHMKDLANAFTEASPHVHLSMKKPTCYRCGKYGHIKKQCRVPEHALKQPATKPRRERSASNVSRSNRNAARESNFQNKQGSSREFSNVAVASAFDAGEDTVTLTVSRCCLFCRWCPV
ncbi:reverse transcriptase [Plakobranchus ocellatus]|uniref:Reverse transcriptase n=1 Tax=Plakobranchus ocellatus TaxID=259542 RepID=A0AAV4DYE9_9GAST|nr:reverse transcriptase [Plakobranchus ocellatus]